MSKRERQKITILTPEELKGDTQMSTTELLEEHEKYDKDHYDPTANLDNKEVLIPKKRSDIITIRLTPAENQVISNLADENGLSKSAFVRMVVKNALKHKEYTR